VAVAGFESWLRTLGPDGLADLLVRRPDVVRSGRQLRSLNAVATDLLKPHSTWAALVDLDGFTTGVAEALVALGKVVHRSELGGFLGEPEQVSSSDVDGALRRLEELALAWSDEPGTWNVSGGLSGVFQSPFGLGPPLHRVMRGWHEQSLRSLASTLGVPARASRVIVQASVEARLRDAASVRARALGAPREAAAVLQTLTWHDSIEGLARTFPSLFGYAPYDELDDHRHGRGASIEYSRMDAVLRWLLDNGFLVSYAGADHMPREVALALRGDGWRPPVRRQPQVTTVPVNAAAVRGDAAAAGSQLLRDLSGLLTTLADEPAATLRSENSGVGVREVKRLAKRIGVEPWRVELLLVLAAGLGLLVNRRDSVATSPAADEWRRLDPASRLVDLLREWWVVESSPTHRLDMYSGKPKPVLAHGSITPPARRLRHCLVAVLADVPEGWGTTGPEGALEAAAWRRPLGMPDPALLAEAAAAVWREAHALGVLAVDAAAPLGRALATGRPRNDEMRAVASTMVPSEATTAVFQSDLTAIVEGVASAQLTDLLGSCAVLEASGTVSRWRLSDHSVRGALDGGTTARELLDALSAVAAKPLPQPLTYLVEDVRRRHGHLRVTNLRCAVVSTDEVLLMEALHHRKLTNLRLRTLSPTVLASGKPAAETVAALRAAGFLPVQEDADGTVNVERGPGAPRVSARQAAASGLAPRVTAFARDASREEFDLEAARSLASLVFKA
jgi:Helicase conserved C-terminal domain